MTKDEAAIDGSIINAATKAMMDYEERNAAMLHSEPRDRYWHLFAQVAAAAIMDQLSNEAA